MKNINRLFIIAAEPSGDLLAKEFIEEVREINPKLEIRAVGGDKIESIGISSEISIDGLSIFGFKDALKVAKLAKEKAKQAAKIANDWCADSIIMIDSWGFSILVAKELEKLNNKAYKIKMVGPQVWATRPKRAQTLAKYFDEVWCIHDFELPFYEGLNIKTKIIGNPALSRIKSGNKEAFIESNNLENKKLIGLLPGSRKKEVFGLLPIMLDVALELYKNDNGLAFIIPVPNLQKENISLIVKQKFSEIPNWLILANEDEKENVFSSLYAAIACSGTVTTEIAVFSVPMIIGYVIDSFTYFIVKNFMLKSKFISLINVAADKEIAKELLQKDFNQENILSYIKPLIYDDKKRLEKINEQNEALKRMGFGDKSSAEIAAQCLFE